MAIAPWQSLSAESTARVDQLTRQWHAAMAVLNALPDHGRSSTVPWFLVIGPARSGKSTLLTHAGLGLDPIITTDANDTAVVGACTCWVGPQAVFIEVAATLLCDHAYASDWRALMRLIARARRQMPIRGVLLIKPLAEQFRQTPAETTAEATLTRDRLQDVAEITGAVLPTYVVITKADLLGGFKEFFTTNGREESPLGLSVSWPPERDPLTGVNHAFPGLLAGLYDRRLTALATAVSEVAQRKLLQFPAQLRAALPYLSNHLAVALQPVAPTEPTLRGVYLTSVPPNPRPSATNNDNANEEPKSLFVATPLAPPPPVRPVVATTNPPPVSHQQHQRAQFVAELFAQVVLSDTAVARRSAASQQHHQRIRVTCLIIILVTSALLGWMSWSSWRGLRVVDDLRQSLTVLAEHRRDHTTDIALPQVDRLGTALRHALAHHGADLGPAAEGAAARYLRTLRPVLLDGCLATLREELAVLRDNLANQQQTNAPALTLTERDADVIRAYLALGGLSAAPPELLTRVLLHDRRWFRAIDPPGGRCEQQRETLARQQLDLCVEVLLPAGLLRIEIDRPLAEDLQRELRTRLPP